MKYDPATLSPHITANFIDVTTINGNFYVDFSYLDPARAMGKVEGEERSQTARLVARVALSPESAFMLQDMLTTMLQTERSQIAGGVRRHAGQ